MNLTKERMANQQRSSVLSQNFSFNESNAVIGDGNNVIIKNKMKNLGAMAVPKIDEKQANPQFGSWDDELPPLKDEMKNGYVFVMHNFIYNKRQESLRHGSRNDVKELKQMFEGQFGFTFRLEENLTAEEMITKTQESISERDYSKNDSFFFVILGHGSNDGILGVDEEPVSLALITDLFTADKCPSLQGKPKVFIVQACRGEKSDFGCVVSDAISWNVPEFSMPKIPIESDFLVCYSCPIGYSSFRDKERGSWYIQDLVQIFKKYAKKEHLMDLMIRVNHAVSHKVSPDGCKQVPSEECRLTKKYYFAR